MWGVLAALDLIPNDWQNGALPEIVMLGAVVAAIGAIFKMVVLPVARWMRRLVIAVETATDRLAQVPEHDDRLDLMESQICEIVEALRPTNGDRRSISDRLDTVKQQTAENATQIAELKVRVDSMLGGRS